MTQCLYYLSREAKCETHYMTIHRREPNKVARFAASASTPPRTHYPASTLPFLSRSVEEMQNPSPYDSGYDSNFSTASGPGHPPSSRGNSDIDDQVKRYIRDQRVATIVDTNIVETMLPSPPAINILNAHRIIARFHQTMAYRTIFPSVPPLVPDSDTETDSDDSDAIPPLISISDAEALPKPTRTTPHYIRIRRILTDDEQNEFCRFSVASSLITP